MNATSNPPPDGCLQSIVYSAVGALFATIVVFGLCLSVGKVGDASQDVFVWLGLNPREEPIVCLVVLVLSTIISGIILGVGVKVIVSLARRMK